jgi:hypothetical protein
VTPRLRALAVVLVLAAALGACGSADTKRADAYVADVNRAQESFADTVTRLSRRITGASSAAQDRGTLAGYSDAVDTIVAELRAVDAPERVRPLHRRLVAQIAGFGSAVRRARRGLASLDGRDVGAAQRGLAAATRRVGTQMAATIASINDRLRG